MSSQRYPNPATHSDAGVAWMSPGIRRIIDRIIGQPVLMRLLSLITMLAVLIYGVADFPLATHLALSCFAIATALIATYLRPELRLISVVLSLALSFRYIIWRGLETLNLDSTLLEAVISLMLYGAEVYTVFVLVGGYFQTTVFFDRRPADLPLDGARQPSVDIFVPSYSEGADIVRRTLVSAMAIDYANKKVYLLDDGRREEMRALAAEVGCGYITRPDNDHAKAGNINAALPKTDGEFIAFFDADHAPVRSFLTLTMGFFLKNDRLALVQTPHHFYNPDPFERNLYQVGHMPPEQNLFYHLVQVSNDFWNSSFFCGSCAVIRREALEEIEGVAVETVTEDAHTSLKMHARGWDSAYLNIPQAAGLATESFGAYVGQRIRWARGMAQILRVDPPFLKKGLSWYQRVNYTFAATHFLFGLPRLIFLLSPVTYLAFGLNPLDANVITVLYYAVPHLVLAYINASAAHGNQRHTFWPEVYETAIAPYTALVTTAAFFLPKMGSFNVTPKGAVIDRSRFDLGVAWVSLVLLLATTFAMVLGIWKLWVYPLEVVTLTVVLFWNFYNMILLLASIAVAIERPQRRAVYRIPVNYPATLHEAAAFALAEVEVEELDEPDEVSFAPVDELDHGEVYTGVAFAGADEAALDAPVAGSANAPSFLPDTQDVPAGTWTASGQTLDLSEDGVRLLVDTSSAVPRHVHVSIVSDTGERAVVPAEVLAAEKHGEQLVVRARFAHVDRSVRHALIRLMFSNPNAWSQDAYVPDRPLRALMAVLSAPFRALAIYFGLARPPREDVDEAPEGAVPTHTQVLQCFHCQGVLLRPMPICPHCGEPLMSVEEAEAFEDERITDSLASSRAARRRENVGWSGFALPVVFVVCGLVLLFGGTGLFQADQPVTTAEAEELAVEYAIKDAYGLADDFADYVHDADDLPRDWGRRVMLLRNEYPTESEGKTQHHRGGNARQLSNLLAELHTLDSDWRRGENATAVRSKADRIVNHLASLRDATSSPLL